jgi:hypothetical protein
MGEQVLWLMWGQEELEDRLAHVEQRGLSPDTWMVEEFMGEEESVVGGEEGEEVDVMEERQESLDEVELGSKHTLCRNPRPRKNR